MDLQRVDFAILIYIFLIVNEIFLFFFVRHYPVCRIMQHAVAALRHGLRHYCDIFRYTMRQMPFL